MFCTNRWKSIFGKDTFGNEKEQQLRIDAKTWASLRRNFINQDADLVCEVCPQQIVPSEASVDLCQAEPSEGYGFGTCVHMFGPRR